MKSKLLIKLTLLFLFLFFININAVKAAGSCTFSINGNNRVYQGQNLTLTVSISGNSVPGGIKSAQGNMEVTGSFSLVSVTSASSILNPSYANGKFIGASQTNASIKESGNLLTIVVKANTVGEGIITLRNLKAGDGSGDSVSCNGSISKSITSNEPPSSNADLASLSVSNYSITPGFSAGNTTYNLNVNSNVSSITVNAKTSDSGAKLNGTGIKNLNYGNNTIKVTVTALAGNTKTYTLIVNRKDTRSSNNNLKGLTSSAGNINFSTETTTYNIEVPFDVSKVDFSAIADNNAKVNINSPDLVPEETKTATITVTAENGTVKTYTINITRGKDPNKPLLSENRLEFLKASVGILSPIFDQDKTNYEIYLPFEISNITFEYATVDKKYAIVEKSGNDELNVGINKFIFKVIAEDKTIKEYNVIVHRLEEVSSETSNNTYLKNITLKSGKLKKTFDKNQTYYYFTGNLKIEEAIPEDDKTNVNIFPTEKGYIILLKAASGDFNLYVFEKQKLDIIPYFIGGGIAIGGVYILNLICKKRLINGGILWKKSKKTQKK